MHRISVSTPHPTLAHLLMCRGDGWKIFQRWRGPLLRWMPSLMRASSLKQCHPVVGWLMVESGMISCIKVIILVASTIQPTSIAWCRISSINSSEECSRFQPISFEFLFPQFIYECGCSVGESFSLILILDPENPYPHLILIKLLLTVMEKLWSPMTRLCH